MLSSLLKTLDDSEASVRGAVAIALGNFGDRASVEPLKRRMDVEESIHVRASLEQALDKLEN
jgi:HEAT repeat protein